MSDNYGIKDIKNALKIAFDTALDASYAVESKLRDKEGIVSDIKAIRKHLNSLSDYSLEKLEDIIGRFWHESQSSHLRLSRIKRSLKIPMLKDWFEFNKKIYWEIQDTVLWLLVNEIDCIRGARQYDRDAMKRKGKIKAENKG